MLWDISHLYLLSVCAQLPSCSRLPFRNCTLCQKRFVKMRSVVAPRRPYGCNISPNNSPSPTLAIYHLESKPQRVEFVWFGCFVPEQKGHGVIDTERSSAPALPGGTAGERDWDQRDGASLHFHRWGPSWRREEEDPSHVCRYIALAVSTNCTQDSGFGSV